ncbi:MAG: hypothetical protein KGH57_00590 [Candidatus Micrarchaeota archaeon]|nr:hypothetical protein [Candidatus Micrarchaeota archaeon]
MAVSQRFLFALLIMLSFIFIIMTYVLTVDPIIKLALAAIGLAVDVVAFSTKLYMSFFIPFMQMKGRNAVIDDTEPFTLAPSGNAIVVRKGSDIFASAFIKIPAYRSSTEMNAEEKVDFSRLFSRALTISKVPVKFGAQLYVINKDAYISNIKNKLDEAEGRYQSASVSKDVPKSESERIRGEVTMWHNLFDNVNKVRSQSLDAFAMVTAQGGSEEEATNLAVQQADELASGVSAVFGVTASIIEGEEILKYLEPDYMIPLATVSEQMRESHASEMT